VPSRNERRSKWRDLGGRERTLIIDQATRLPELFAREKLNKMQPHAPSNPFRPCAIVLCVNLSHSVNWFEHVCNVEADIW
jgi:hypothetical protein